LGLLVAQKVAVASQGALLVVSGWVRIRKRSILFITHNKETGLANQELAVSERH